VPFVSQLAPAANRARPTQASRTRNTPHSVSADQLKDRKSVLVANDPDFLFMLFHLFRLLMQLRRSHTHQQRELGPRLKFAFLNTPFLFQHGLMVSQSIGLRRYGKSQGASR
jgi:hypothetical protein